jgi:hypothetical protein
MRRFIAVTLVIATLFSISSAVWAQSRLMGAFENMSHF